MKTEIGPVETSKRGAQSLSMRMRNTLMKLKGATIIYGLLPHAARFARTTVKVRKTKLLSLVLIRAQKRISEQALHGSLRGVDRRTSVYYYTTACKLKCLFDQLSILT